MKMLAQVSTPFIQQHSKKNDNENFSTVLLIVVSNDDLVGEVINNPAIF